MQRLSAIAEAIAGASKKTEKIELLAAYLHTREIEEAAVSAVFLSGRPFPAWEETTLQAGGALLVRVILEVAGRRDTDLEKAYRETGDLGAAASRLLTHEPAALHAHGLNVLDVARAFREIAAARGPAAKAALLRRLLDQATPLEAKYLIKIITGELRIGLRESLVEQAIASAFGVPAQEVERANMLLGDIGETLRLAAGHNLQAARLRMFHPLGFMLASPIDSAGEAFDWFPQARVEDKYDGIRAQAHCSAAQVRLFSRTRDDITESFPELVEPLSAIPGAILDGEIVAWDFLRGQALPFSELQKRLGRKRVTAGVIRAVPVAYVAFDLLCAGNQLVIDRPLRERSELLDRVFADAKPRSGTARRGTAFARDLQGSFVFEPAIVEKPERPDSTLVVRAPALHADSSLDLEELFTRAQARGNEGLMIKDPESRYAPGRRGHSWLKMKRELATLDVIVTSVEWGHGRRSAVLSDYTFAVRAATSGVPDTPAFGGLRWETASRGQASPRTPSGDLLLNVGKAYSGLADREIAQMTGWFLTHTIADHGFWREVEPVIVVEVAFNAIMRSERHASGYALRFPRILRLRPDKSVEDIDTLDRVRQIWERQQIPKIA